MRALIASTVSVAAAAALVVPLVLPEQAAAREALPAADAADAGAGGVQSLPLRPLDGGTRSGGAEPVAGAMGLAPRAVEPYALVGIVWSDADAELAGVAQVRTRSRETGEWSGWYDLHASTEHGPDENSPERLAGTVRGGTDPLWVGDADGVQARVLPGPVLPPEPDADRETDAAGHDAHGDHGGHDAHGDDGGHDDHGAHDAHDDHGGHDDHAGPGPGGHDGAHGRADARAALPDGLRLELVTPGAATDDDGAPVPRDPRDRGAAQDTELDAIHRLEQELDQELARDTEQDIQPTAAAPRPGIVTRSGWGADESWREPGYVYTKVVKTVFVHHTAGTNNYTCAQAPSVIRGIYQYHTRSQGWRDIGYNFLVDKCGTIYEGRAGGVAKPVQGAHTYGFNHNSMGVAVLGSYGGSAPGSEVTTALARLAAWKLGLDGRDPAGTWRRVSSGGKYSRGTVVTMHNISGHRDGFSTECPGDRLYGQLPSIRSSAARM